MSAAKFMGNVACFCIGMALWKMGAAAIHGSHDAKVALSTLAIFIATSGFAFWCYWGETK